MHSVPERVPQETEVIGSIELPKEIAKDITGDEVLRVGTRVYVKKTSANDENHIFAIPIDGDPSITDEEELAIRDTLSPQDTDIVVSFPNQRKLFSAIPVSEDPEISSSRFAYTLDTLRQQEADLLSEPFIPPSVITSQIFPNHTRKDMADIVYGRAKDEKFNSTSYWEYVDKVIDRLLLDAPEFM